MAEKPTNQRSKSAIVLSLGIAFFILVFLPLISLWYMNKGVGYRMEQLDKLERLDSLTNISCTRLDGELYGSTYFENKVILIFPEEKLCDESHRDVFNVLYKKLNTSKGVSFFIKPSEDKPCSYWRTEMENAFVISSENNQQIIEKLTSLENRALIEPNSTILVDKNKYIARAYSLETKEDLELLLIHVTILLPPLKTI